MDTDRKAYSVREFCARNGICRQTFYDEIRRGRLHARKLGKKTSAALPGNWKAGADERW
jgi:predicted DNA-binding protein YlxM (UPF0122 family)